MTESASTFLNPWLSFYAMTGTSAASLTGLTFVVITLVSGTERLRRNPEGLGTFSTPTLMHFGAVLLVSAVLEAPWHSMLHPGVLIGLAGLFGVVYIVRVIYRTARLTVYTPDVEDWTWYSILPFIAYGTIIAGAIAIFSAPAHALFALAGGVILLLFIGIRNAWDVVTFLATGQADEP